MARPGGVRIEIHWGIVHPTAPFAIDLDGIWERARPARVAGVQALVMSAEDLVLHLCLHASFSHKFRVGLRACWDVLEVVRHDRDAIVWEQVVRRAREWGVARYVYLTLRLVREMLIVDVPATALAALEPPGFGAEVVAWARSSIFAPERNATVSPAMAKLWTSRPLRTKWGVLMSTLCPSRAAMARIHRTPADSAAVYLYYVVRWADVLRRYGRHAWCLWRGDPGQRHELRAVCERGALRDWLAGGRAVAGPS